MWVVAAQDWLFGRRHGIPVAVVAVSEQLTALRQALRVAVRPFAAVPDEPAFTGAGFRPHVTTKSRGRVQAGDEFTLTQLAVVAMPPPFVARSRCFPRSTFSRGGRVGA